jgi:hypothetical protein
MPTFESIPLHPVLKQRLLEPPNPGGVSISTPQALLSRTPQALADQILLTNPSKDGSNGGGFLGGQRELVLEVKGGSVVHGQFDTEATGVLDEQEPSVQV